MPKLDVLESCLAADRGGIEKRLSQIKAKKRNTKVSLYRGLLKARQYIDLQYMNEFNVEDLAKLAGIASAHFAREFKNSFKTSPYEYLIERRMAQARVLLKTTDVSITEIAMQVGYPTLSNFISTFKRVHRHAPQSYRKMHQNLHKN